VIASTPADTFASAKVRLVGRLFCTAVAALAFLVGFTPDVVARPWRLADIFSPSLPRIPDVRISPDGTHALAMISFADMGANVFTGSYRLVDVADGTWRPMPAGAFHPRWSPDGSTIAWTFRTKGSLIRIMLTDAAGNRSRMLTTGTRSILAFSWSPDSSTIAAIEVALTRTPVGI
jgi:dipeptidyl aminopeptidase/acylaminoacyl peptidase